MSFELGAVRRLCLCLVVTCCSVIARPAAAQDAPGPDPVAAELFRQGRDLITQDQWKEGCDKLAASMRRFAATSTLMNLASCREHDGLVASAWVMYQRALVLNRETAGAKRRAQLEAVGRAAIAKLEPRLPRLRVTIKPSAVDARVSEGGNDLPLDTTVPLDPGAHELLATAPGRPDVKRKIELREAETLAVEITFADPAPSAVDASEAAPPRAGAHDQTGPGAPTPPDSGVPGWVWASGAAGLAFGGVSIGFAIDAVNANSELASRCGSDLKCDEDLAFDPEPLNARKNRGIGFAVGFGIGAFGGLIATGVGLLTTGRASPASVAVGPAVTPWITSQTAGVVASGSL